MLSRQLHRHPLPPSQLWLIPASVMPWQRLVHARVAPANFHLLINRYDTSPEIPHATITGTKSGPTQPL